MLIASVQPVSGKVGPVTATAYFSSRDRELDDNGMASLSVEELVPGLVSSCHVASIAASPLSFDCDDTGDNEVSETVTTTNGSTTQGTAYVTIRDHTSPRFISTPQASLFVNDESDFPDPFPVTYTDNCLAEMNYEENRSNTGCGYQLERNWIITDDAGNQDQFAQTIMLDGSLQKDLLPVAAHLNGLRSGDTLHVEECIPYNISRDDLNAGNDPNASFKTNIYRLPLQTPVSHRKIIPSSTVPDPSLSVSGGTIDPPLLYIPLCNC